MECAANMFLHNSLICSVLYVDVSTHTNLKSAVRFDVSTMEFLGVTIYLPTNVKSKMSKNKRNININPLMPSVRPLSGSGAQTLICIYNDRVLLI